MFKKENFSSKCMFPPWQIMLLVTAVLFLVFFVYKSSDVVALEDVPAKTIHLPETLPLRKELPEGSECITRNITGKCVKMHTCSSLVVDIMDPHRNKTYPDICSYDGNTPIVCCTSCENDFKFSNISNLVYAPTGHVFMKSGRKYYDKCLEYSKYADFFPRCHRTAGVQKLWNEKNKCYYLQKWQQMAVGGIPAGRETYTHMALLGFGPHQLLAQWLCGGSLISERFILTAAHCTYDARLGPVKYAALGILKRSDPEELWQRYNIISRIPHPEYSPPSKYHDIALLMTDRPVEFNHAVFPACLLEDDDQAREFTFHGVTAIGWGAVGHRKPVADVLQVVNLRGHDDETCREHYPPDRLLTEGYNSTTQMCFGADYYGLTFGEIMDRPIDTCEGDSGGPLQIEIDDLCMYFVMGVTSFGRACGYPRRTGMYTRVRPYLPWIESIVWPDH